LVRLVGFTIENNHVPREDLVHLVVCVRMKVSNDCSSRY